MSIKLMIGLVVGLLWLGSCGEDEKPSIAAVDLEAVDPQGQEVVFWYQHTREREEALLELIAEFNRTNPHGIQVRGEFAGGYGDIYNKMLVALQGGGAPQLVVAYQNQALAYYQAGGIVDLKPYMHSPRWGISPEAQEDYVRAFVEQDRVHGVQIGFPPNRSMEVFYYNAEWLRELGYQGPPETWSAFAQMCRRARAQPFSKAEKKERCRGFLLEMDASRIASMVFTHGGDLTNADRTAYTFNTPQMKAALGLMRELRQEGAVDLVGEPGSDQTEFVVGQVLFAMRSSSGLPFFKSGVEDSGQSFDWGVASPPHEGEKPVVNVYGASVSVCRATPAQQLAAWLFVRWFTEPAQQARWVRASNYFPVRQSAAADLEDYFAENPAYKTAYELLAFGKSEPSMAGYQQVRRLMEDAVVEIMDGADLDKTLARLEREANNTIEDN